MISAILFGLVLTGNLVLLAGCLWAIGIEKANYNGGFCTKCPGSPMVRFDTDSQGGRGYRCDQCFRRIWVSWGVDK